ncbi:MAG: GntR family transcriptional regulator [Pseudomonadota bacterium]
MAHAVRNLIVDGSLRDGARINEVSLSEELGISRTPLRDGLTQLVGDGIVYKAPKRGFFVAPMTLDEFNEIYDIRPILDPEALRMAGVPNQSNIEKLRKLNRRMRDAKTASKAIDLDNQWHLSLLEQCPNSILVDLIRNLMGRTRRYEYALFRETTHVWIAGDEHDQILDALADAQLRRACQMLRQNMRTGAEPIREWLRARVSA